MAKSKKPLAGTRQVLNNLNKEIQKIKTKSMAGLIEAAIFIRRESEPLTPVDLGNLRASFFIVTSQGKVKEGVSPNFVGPNASTISSAHSATMSQATSLVSDKNIPIVVLGFGANYAASVHEDLEMIFRRPGAQAKFLESVIKGNEKTIVDIIAKNIEIK